MNRRNLGAACVLFCAGGTTAFGIENLFDPRAPGIAAILGLLAGFGGAVVGLQLLNQSAASTG